MKKIIACLVLSAMVCGVFASCGDKEESSSSSEPATEAPTTEPVEEDPTEDEEPPVAAGADDVEFEDAVVAESGDAYLAIVDGQWWIQYWGGNDEKNPLTYNAGVVPITGNGDYTVSVTADTNGFRFDTTGDVSDQYVPGGLEFMAVMIKDGETLFPGAVITINSVKVDGAEIALSAKNYTSSDDGVETRSNIYNQWVSKPSADGRSVEGNLYDDDGNELDITAGYSAQLVDKADFAEWTTVEVDFTVSGIAE